jgi:hypothetical protein
MISARTAFLLYAALALLALLTLKGKYLALGLIIVLALAAKTFVDELRRRQ